MSDTFEHMTGTVVLTAMIQTKPVEDCIARFRSHVLAVKDSALSDNEPGALEYRISQSKNFFMIWAKFINSKAVIAHTQTSAYWDMHMDDDVHLEPPHVQFFEEI